MPEEIQSDVPVVDETIVQEKKPMSFEDGVIKVDLSELNKPVEDAIPEQEADASDVPIVQPEDTPSSEEVVEEVPQEQEPVQVEAESIIEEITEEEVAETAEDLEEEVEEAIEEQIQSGTPLPENLQKVVDFMEETNGTLEDYVRLNQDYSSLNDNQLLREYYEATKPHLEKEDIDFLMEDNFDYDEDIDEERDIRRKKLARREELAKAKSHLEGLKGKYYEEIKGGSKLNPEQKEAVDFFNRYKKENKEASEVAGNQASIFNKKTQSLFSNDFKGFDFNVGEKKFRFKVNNVDQVKTTQSDINNFVKKFLNEKNEMNDAKGYHKSLFTAMNADKIAEHFYEQGRADVMKDSVRNSKNIDMNPRGTHEKVVQTGGVQFKSVPGNKTSKFGIKTRK